MNTQQQPLRSLIEEAYLAGYVLSESWETPHEHFDLLLSLYAAAFREYPDQGEIFAEMPHAYLTELLKNPESDRAEMGTALLWSVNNFLFDWLKERFEEVVAELESSKPGYVSDMEEYRADDLRQRMRDAA